MNKIIIFGLSMSSVLCAWEDHPDRDEDRRDAVADSNCYVQGGYDWSNRDKEGRDHHDNDDICRGTIGGPNDSKD